MLDISIFEFETVGGQFFAFIAVKNSSKHWAAKWPYLKKQTGLT